ncbi:MAG: DEAD/DEAH box helicase [Clostridiaceae bacterium]|nr:DEAD/DEAH box helicase [Clostridiaceae bacterium]
MELSPELMQAIEKMGFTDPTGVQARTILPMLDWHDIIAKAPTGTGKTTAFGIPALEHLEINEQGIQVLILAPTRELAIQIGEEMTELAAYMSHVRIAVVYGGRSIGNQIEEVRHKPQIMVATPGRLIDLMKRNVVHLGAVHTVILDEADRMLDMGFVRDVRYVLDKMPKVSQIAMFSATMSRSVMDISWIYQREPVEIVVEASDENKPQIDQFQIVANGAERLKATVKLIEQNSFEKVMVFCNTKYMTEAVARKLKKAGVKAESIHGDINQSMREKVIKGFRNGNISVLVCTDVAARGIDVEGVEAVINYEIPNENEHYTHRIGRTGRAGRKGVAYTFTSPVHQVRLESIIRYTRTEMELLEI